MKSNDSNYDPRIIPSHYPFIDFSKEISEEGKHLKNVSQIEIKNFSQLENISNVKC